MYAWKFTIYHDVHRISCMSDTNHKFAKREPFAIYMEELSLMKLSKYALEFG